MVTTSFDTSPDFPESVVVSGDGPQVYIDPSSSTASITTLTSPDTIESLSVEDGGVVHGPIPVGETPAFASISPDRTRVYALNFLAGTISVVDTASWTVSPRWTPGAGASRSSARARRAGCSS